MYNKQKMNLSELEKTKIRGKLRPFTAIALILAGSVALAGHSHAVTDLDDMCPISQLYYDLGDSQKAYKHQIKHYNKSGLGCDFEYRTEKYIAPDGYTMNDDGKTCYTTDKPIEVEIDGKVFYVAPEGYILEGDKCIKTIEANYQSEGIIVSDSMGEPTSMIYYDEEQKKLVKI